MKKVQITACMVFMLFLSVCVHAQTSGLNDREPTVSEMEAPLYPGAVFIRTVSGLNPYYETAMYVTIDPLRTVENYFERKMPEKRKSFYSPDNTMFMTIFLLKTWSQFPGNPTKEDLSKLEQEPSIQMYEYDRDSYETLAEFYDRKPEDKPKAEALRTGRTLILYTYKRTEEYKSETKIRGTWISTDRDLLTFYKSTLIFDDKGEYTFTFTPGNIEELVKSLSTREKFKGKSTEEIVKIIESCNPEKGTYVIMRNTITLVSRNPVMEPETKNGIAFVGSAVLSLDFIGMPRLSFIRIEQK
ncbi:hypothetical protein LLG96_08380 [bacterium]|nr:hypothetical protein [bacterium]